MIITEGVVAWPHTARVVLSITCYGAGSPRSGWPGDELTASALSGWCSVNGVHGEPPVRMSGFQAGYVAGAVGFLAAAAALRRQHSGRPQRVDVSEVEGHDGAPVGVSTVYQERDQAGLEDRRPVRGTPGPLSQAADGPLSMAVAYFRHWPQAMAGLGLPERGTEQDLIADGTPHTRDISHVIDKIVATLPSRPAVRSSTTCPPCAAPGRTLAVLALAFLAAVATDAKAAKSSDQNQAQARRCHYRRRPTSHSPTYITKSHWRTNINHGAFTTRWPSPDIPTIVGPSRKLAGRNSGGAI